MPRIHLPLLPLPVLAVLVAVSACSKRKSEETTHLIPPPTPYATLAAATPTPAPAATKRKPTAPADEAPTADEVKAFDGPVLK